MTNREQPADPLTDEQKLARLHTPVCNFWTQPIGAPGCICVRWANRILAATQGAPKAEAPPANFAAYYRSLYPQVYSETEYAAARNAWSAALAHAQRPAPDPSDSLIGKVWRESVRTMRTGGGPTLIDREAAQRPAPDLYLTARQILAAKQWALPQGHEPDDLDTVWRLGAREAGADEEGEPYEAGPVMWLADYPEEGCLALDVPDDDEAAQRPAGPATPDPQRLHVLTLAVTDLANAAYRDGREEKAPWNLRWQELEARILALAPYCCRILDEGKS